MKKRRLLLFFLLLPVIAFAQTAAEVDAMLEADTITAAKAARFVLGTADLLPSGLSGPDAERAAYDTASSNGWIKVDAYENLTMKDAAFLIMKAFDLKGGMMYSLFKNPRYAYREMVYRKLIMSRMDSSAKISGSGLLQILDRVIRSEE